MSKAIKIPKLGSICLLCQKTKPIENSHVYPKFAVNWLKENSSPYFRTATTPNRRQQDVNTFPILCLSCENLFSKVENLFCTRVFKPFRADLKLQSFEYGRWLSHFAISLSWRMLAVQLQEFQEKWPGQAEVAAIAFESWRSYLLGETCKIRPYGHHMFFFSELDIASSNVGRAPENIHTYLHTSFDGDICSFGSRGIVFVLIPGIMFWSPIHPNDDKGWSKGSAIADKGRFSISQKVDDLRFRTVIEDGCRIARELNFSEKQDKKIQEDYQRILSTTSKEKMEKIMRPKFLDYQIREAKRLDKE